MTKRLTIKTERGFVYLRVICHFRTTQQTTTTGHWKHIFQN